MAETGTNVFEWEDWDPCAEAGTDERTEDTRREAYDPVANPPDLR